VAADLVVKLGVLDGDGRLVGEGLQPFHVLLGEEAGLAAVQVEEADHLAVGADGRRRIGLDPGGDGPVLPFAGADLGDIADQAWLPGQVHAVKGGRLQRDAQGQDVLDQLRVVAAPVLDADVIAFDQGEVGRVMGHHPPDVV